MVVASDGDSAAAEGEAASLGAADGEAAGVASAGADGDEAAPPHAATTSDADATSRARDRRFMSWVEPPVIG